MQGLQGHRKGDTLTLTLHSLVYPHVHTCTSTYTHAHSRTHVHEQVHTHTHTHTHSPYHFLAVISNRLVSPSGSRWGGALLGSSLAWGSVDRRLVYGSYDLTETAGDKCEKCCLQASLALGMLLKLFPLPLVFRQHPISLPWSGIPAVHLTISGLFCL